MFSTEEFDGAQSNLVLFREVLEVVGVAVGTDEIICLPQDRVQNEIPNSRISTVQFDGWRRGKCLA